MSKLTEFNNYKLVHNFMHPDDPLKKWIDKENFQDYFRNDWNSLMEVVEKIEALGFIVTIKMDECEIISQRSFNMNFFGGGSKINATYKIVVQFIKWYNKNK